MKNTQQSDKTRELLMSYCQAYPDVQIRDVFKFIYQSSFGCEHLVSSEKNVTDYIRAEADRGVADTMPYVEPLDGDYCRVSLHYINLGLSADTLGRLFFLSAKKEPEGETELKKKLEIAKALVKENKLSFSVEDFEREISLWEADGYPSVHHSDAFREKYAPSYRVIQKRYIPFLPLFAEIDKRLSSGVLSVAVEGGSASGKTTLGEMLREVYGCTVFHADDFFLRPEQRTPERLAEVGGNLDRERLLEEVLVPLSKGETVSYRRFDCSEMTVLPPVGITPGKLTVTEGAYSMHPELRDYYDFSVFLDISPELQKERILKRNTPQMAERFFNEWIPLENVYFHSEDIRNKCSMRIEITD